MRPELQTMGKVQRFLTVPDLTAFWWMMTISSIGLLLMYGLGIYNQEIDATVFLLGMLCTMAIISAGVIIVAKVRYALIRKGWWHAPCVTHRRG